MDPLENLLERDMKEWRAALADIVILQLVVAAVLVDNWTRQEADQ